MTNGRIMKQLRHCHSERSEESLVLLVEAGTKRKKSEMFRSAQHDRAMVAGKSRTRKHPLASRAAWALSFLRASSFGFRHFAGAERPRSHVLDHVVPELRALDLSRAVHQPREVIRDAFAFDRAAQTFENQVGDFRPAHVTEHHFT